MQVCYFGDILCLSFWFCLSFLVCLSECISCDSLLELENYHVAAVCMSVCADNKSYLDNKHVLHKKTHFNKKQYPDIKTYPYNKAYLNITAYLNNMVFAVFMYFDSRVFSSINDHSRSRSATAFMQFKDPAMQKRFGSKKIDIITKRNP